jgi:hypothetical protein
VCPVQALCLAGDFLGVCGNSRQIIGDRAHVIAPVGEIEIRPLTSKATRQKLLIMLAITLAGLACSVLYHHVLALHNDVSPFNTFLFDQNLR